MDSTKVKNNLDFQERYLVSSLATINKLQDKIKDGIEVVPFIGAGVSKPFGAPLWPEFLKDVFNEFKNSPRHRSTILKIEKLFEKNKLEEVADCLYKNSKDKILFEQLIRDKFYLESSTKKHLHDSLVPSIAKICSGPIITTNFDDILEEIVYEILKLKFEKIIPSRDGKFFENACEKLRNNKHVILKIHGDWKDKDSRVLTKTQYDTYYSKPTKDGEINLNNPLPKLIHLMSASKILLFIGCSLEDDRTLKVLSKIFNNTFTFPHYALLPLPDTQKEADKAKKRLSGAGINVIWFKVNHELDNPYKSLYDILESFAKLSSNHRIIKNGKRIKSPISFHSTYLFESLKDSGTVVRHLCNEHQYIKFATGMINETNALSKVIWTMYKFPIEVNRKRMDKDLLTEADKNFQKVSANKKIRIVIFENSKELNSYYDFRQKQDKAIYECNRISAFEKSVVTGRGKLLYATKDSLEYLKIKHLDIGYVQSEIDEEVILFCSNISLEKKDDKESNKYETIVFTSTLDLNSCPYSHLNLNAIIDIIKKININKQDISTGGVYSELKDLKDWQDKYGKK